MLDIYFESPLITSECLNSTLTRQNNSSVEEMGNGVGVGGRLVK